MKPPSSSRPLYVRVARRLPSTLVRGRRRWALLPAIGLALVAGSAAGPALAEDGYELWLRARPLPETVRLEAARAGLTRVVFDAESPTLLAARDELIAGLSTLLDAEIDPADEPSEGPTGDGDIDEIMSASTLVVGTPRSSPTVAALDLGDALERVGDEGYVLRSVDASAANDTDGRGRAERGATLVLAANRDVGVLYGVFHLLRLLRTQQPLAGLSLEERPRVGLRMLDHWDNLDGTVERGYAGFSLWDWHRLPERVDPRLRDYARANASIGINASVLTNVNADATVLTEPYLEKAAALADVFRPWGIRVFLTARFSAPVEIGGLATADPLDPEVAAWWRAKVAQIHRHIPDFGGFLVKADSEGQPGPHDYGRTHADGANLLAAALAPHGGVVLWRAFVYSADRPEDRAKQAWSQLAPLDGRFADNVLLQVKNGPIDFQPREPFHPLFGAMPETPLALEVQITQEYLGFSTHLAFLAPMWEEVLRSDTHARGAGSLVSRVVDGSLFGHSLTAMAGVANTGTDRNWCGSVMACANWYAFGRLAWNPDLSSRTIAEEWTRATFGTEPSVVDPIVEMLLGSREAVVDYTTPLGLHHLMARGHHYGPGPWVEGGPRADWTSVYYHQADADGIGFDRTAKGSDALAQYFPPVRERWSDLDTVPDELLLWFHHVPWNHPTKAGRTLWLELLHRYQRGVDRVRAMQRTWADLEGRIDAERWEQVRADLAVQEREARWWRDACVLYFQSRSGLPIPDGYERSERSLEELMAIEHRHVPGWW